MMGVLDDGDCKVLWERTLLGQLLLHYHAQRGEAKNYVNGIRSNMSDEIAPRLSSSECL